MRPWGQTPSRALTIMSHNTVLDIHHGSVELNSFNAAHKHSKNSTFEEHALDTENVAPGDIVFKSPNTSSYSSIPRTSSSSRHERPSKWRSRSAHGPPPPPPVGRSRSRSPARTPFNAGRRRGYASSLICSPARASHSSKMTQIFEDAQVTLHLKNRRSERKKTTQLLSAPRARRRPLGDLVNREPALQKQDAATVDPQTSTSHHSDKSSIDSCSLESGDARSPGFSSRYDSDSTSYGPVLERAQRRPHGEATNEALSMRHQGEVNASAPSFDPQPRARSPSSPQSKAMEHNSPDGGRSSPRYTAFRSSPNLHLSSSQFASSPRLPSLAPLSKLSEEMESAMGLSSGACTPWPSEKYRQFVADNAKYHPNSCLLPAADSITRGLGNLGMGDSTHQPPTSTTPATLAKGQLGSSSSAKHDEIEHTTTDHSGKQLQVAPMANGPTHESQPKNYSMDATAPLAGSCDDIQEERSESMAAPRSDWSGDDGLFRRRHPHEKFSGPTDGSVETANLLPNTPELRGQSLRLLDYEYDCQGRVSTCPKGPPRGHTLDDIAARLAVADSEDFQEAVNRATGGDDVDWTWNKNSFAKSPPETRVPNASPASHMRWPHELETSNSSNKANLSRTEHEHTVDTNMREIRRPWLSDEGLSSETCNDNRVSPNKSILSPMSETWTGDEEFYHSSATAESRPKTQTVPSWLKRIAGRQKHSSLFPGGLWRHDSVTCQTRPAFKAVVQDENLMHNDVNNDDASYRSSTGEDIYSALLENLSSPSSSYEGYSSPSPVRRHNTLCETSSRGVDGDEISLAPPELEPRRRSFPSLQCLPQASRVLGTHRGVNTLSEALIGHQETKQVHSRLHATPNFVQIIRKASNETADDDNDYVVHTHKSEPWTTESSEPQIIIGASSGGTAYDADWEDASPYRAPDTAHGQISTIPDISSSKSLIASRTTYGQLSRLSTAFSRTLGTPIRNECTVSTRHCSTDGEEEFLSAEESHAPALLSRPTRTFQRKTGMTRLKCSPAAPTLRGDMHGRCDSLISETPTCVERTAPAAANKENITRHLRCVDVQAIPPWKILSASTQMSTTLMDRSFHGVQTTLDYASTQSKGNSCTLLPTQPWKQEESSRTTP
ncbi:hypothetical protein BJ546DRAFT_108951 [Cryomyces antarcticus]